MVVSVVNIAVFGEYDPLRAPVLDTQGVDIAFVIGSAGQQISVVGAGMETHPGTASTMFEALFNQDINIQMISTSEIKISVLIDRKDADRAVAAVHEAFFGNN